MKLNCDLLLVVCIVACMVVISGCKGGSSSKSEEESIFEYVDLGLPSGTKWATCNVGASGPYDSGNLYAWGVVTKNNKIELLTEYKFYDKDALVYTKYVTDSKYGSVDGKEVLEPSDDVATKKCGEEWRMPTREEVEELLRYCSWKKTTVAGKTGYRVIGPSGYSIFLPMDLGIDASRPCYWTSSLASTSNKAYCISLFDGKTRVVEDERYVKYAIRPVIQKAGSHSRQANVAKYEYDRDTTINPNKPAVDSCVDGYDYADLGLPSGLLWATCNIGAKNPEDCGDYFAWGETKSKNNYKWGSYKFYKSGKIDECYPEKTDIKFTKYTKSDGKMLLETSDDAATANWGANWRMPTDEEFNELVENCEWELMENDTLNGFKITGPNGHWLFIPKAGYQTWHGAVCVGNKCKYWTSSRDLDDFIKAYSFSVEKESSDRCDGMPVRPVVSGKSTSGK